MTTVAHSDKRGIPSSSAAPMQNKKEDNSTPIPEIVEERRKDAEGRYVVVNRYTRGKLLGKVMKIHIMCYFAWMLSFFLESTGWICQVFCWNNGQ